MAPASPPLAVLIRRSASRRTAQAIAQARPDNRARMARSMISGWCASCSCLSNRGGACGTGISSKWRLLLLIGVHFGHSGSTLGLGKSNKTGKWAFRLTEQGSQPQDKATRPVQGEPTRVPWVSYMYRADAAEPLLASCWTLSWAS
jgi:hypothetical protein